MKFYIGNETYTISPEANFSDKDTWQDIIKELIEENKIFLALIDLEKEKYINCMVKYDDGSTENGIDILKKQYLENEKAIEYITKQLE